MDYVAYMQREANEVAMAATYVAMVRNLTSEDVTLPRATLTRMMIQVRNHFHAQGEAVPDMVEVPTLRTKRFTL